MELRKGEKLIAKKYPLAIIECTDMGPDDGNRWFVYHMNRKHNSSSLACAIDVGVLDGNGRDVDYELTNEQRRWLDEQADLIPEY